MSLLSKQGLSLIIQAFKKLLSFKADQEDITQSNWQQNDPTKNDYVRGRTHWESYETIVHVDNLTKADYLNEVYPKCNFIPGNVYRVVLNGQVYDRLICYREDEYNVIASANLGCPFYIDDDGGNGFYIGGDFLDNDADDFVVSVIEERNVVHKIDEKYLPDIVETPDWNQNDPNAKNYIKNRPFYEEAAYIPYAEEQVVEFSVAGSASWVEGRIDDLNLPWDWVPYRITLDGVEYEGTFTDNADSGWIDITLNDGTRLQIYDYGSMTIDSADYVGEHTIKIEQITRVSTPIPERFIPDSIARDEDKLDQSNPVGSGSFSLNRKNGSEIGICSFVAGAGSEASGDYSVAIGQSLSARGLSQQVSGQFNIIPSRWILREETFSEIIYVGLGSTLYYSKNYTFDDEEGVYKLVDPKLLGMQTGFNSVFKKIPYCYLISGGSSGAVMYYNNDESAHQNGDSISIRNGKKFYCRKAKNNKGGYLSIVGNGTNNYDRSNAYTLDWDGNGWFAGTLKIGGAGQDDENAKEIADKPYVDAANAEMRDYVDAAKSFTLLRDEETGARYHVFMKNGTLTTTPMCSKLRITTLPDSIDYLPGDLFDPTGMVVEAVHEDGSSTVITDYTYPTEALENGRTSVVIGYTEFGQTFTVNLIDMILIDFEWEDNQDGTVTIVGWKETLNGEPSTELIVPDYDWICI